jgi:hypothetical protein
MKLNVLMPSCSLQLQVSFDCFLDKHAKLLLSKTVELETYRNKLMLFVCVYFYNPRWVSYLTFPWQSKFVQPGSI